MSEEGSDDAPKIGPQTPDIAPFFDQGQFKAPETPQDPEKWTKLMDEMENWPEEKKRAFVKLGTNKGGENWRGEITTKDTRALLLRLPLEGPHHEVFGGYERPIEAIVLTKDGPISITSVEHDVGRELLRMPTTAAIARLLKSGDRWGESGYVTDPLYGSCLSLEKDNGKKIKLRIGVPNDDLTTAKPLEGDFQPHVDRALSLLEPRTPPREA